MVDFSDTMKGEHLLKLKTDEVIQVVEALQSGWWLGCHGDRYGWFPGDFTQVRQFRILEMLRLFDNVHQLVPKNYVD